MDNMRVQSGSIELERSCRRCQADVTEWQEFSWFNSLLNSIYIHVTGPNGNPQDPQGVQIKPHTDCPGVKIVLLNLQGSWMRCNARTKNNKRDLKRKAMLFTAGFYTHTFLNMSFVFSPLI